MFYKKGRTQFNVLLKNALFAVSLLLDVTEVYGLVERYITEFEAFKEIMLIIFTDLGRGIYD